MKNDYAAVRKVINTVTKKRGAAVLTIDSPLFRAESIELRQQRADISIPESERSPLLGLQQAHRDFGRILRDMRSKRQDNLHKLAEAKA